MSDDGSDDGSADESTDIDGGTDADRGADSRPVQGEVGPGPIADRYADWMDRFVLGVELAAATIFAALFAIGVVDLAAQIWQSVRSGAIADPLVVIGFIDTGLLLLIIVEVYNTVLAYVQTDETHRIVQLVIYTGVIAMVRKVIVFRTDEYATAADALFAAVGYTVVVFGLVALLVVERRYGNQVLPSHG